ncbi:YjbH domain-containing protein [Pokkaliibacter sp. CJK22405]|uniref:YjbH domain-containing protein n=1 Tax=Pokkaliibacter sp. CJK22405 TaxID=3384615 RepID=UPI0039855F0B
MTTPATSRVMIQSQATCLRRGQRCHSRPLLITATGLLSSVLYVSQACGSESPYRYSLNDWGTVGLLQTPTARMNPEGQLSFNASFVSPYSRYNIFFQPVPWFEAGFRYTDISGVLYGPRSLSGDQTYKDKAIDAKFRLWQESRFLPELAVGGVDISGTGLFSGEYLVASKRWDDFDFSLGMGWGYLANRGDLDNPLGQLSDKFNTRERSTTTGDANFGSYFRGNTALFGGVAYHPSWAPVVFKAEYEGNDYQSEPQGSNQTQDSPINLGIVYQVNDNIDLHLGWERGNTAMMGITLTANTSKDFAQSKFDPPPQPIQPTPNPDPDWQNVSAELKENAGFDVKRISQREHEIIVEGSQTKYRNNAKGEVRAARILSNNAPAEVDSFTFVQREKGLDLRETGLSRTALKDVVNNRQPGQALVNSADMTVIGERNDKTLYQHDLPRFRYGIAPGLTQSLGGPDGFYLYQLRADATAGFTITPGWELDAQASYGLIDNFDKFKYTAPSNLPRVRTYIREYLVNSDLSINNLQLTHFWQWDQNWFGQAYGGILEAMYGGVGGELLYRPIGSNWALGADLDIVRQRDFNRADIQAFRDYQTWTTNLTGYYRLPFYDSLAKVSVGRYLAKDIGATFDLSRRFDSGVQVGAWATLTDASGSETGEGSFDKGIYVTIPFDAFFTNSTTRSGRLQWAPLTRDGGQKVDHRYSLYDLTESRDARHYFDGYREALEP